MKIFEDLNGKILTNIEGKVGDEELLFTTLEGENVKLYHEQD